MSNQPAILSALPLALNSEGATDDAPEWVQLTPTGPVLPGIDGRSWTLSAPDAVIAACRAARGGAIEIPVDFEHASHVKGAKGERADAVGWVRDLELREGALWGRVEWLATGREAVASRAYRFVSPGFHFRPGTREVSRLVSVGLTNVPNFSMPALNRAQKETTMDPDVLKALGLAPDAGPAAAVTAINALKTAEQTALNRAQNPDPDKWVPKADYELATNRVSELEAEAKTRTEAEIEQAVDWAVENGKFSPANRDYHLATCRTMGVAAFREHWSKQPDLVGGKPAQPADPASTPRKLSADDLALCRSWGMDPKDFAAARAAEQEQ